MAQSLEELQRKRLQEQENADRSLTYILEISSVVDAVQCAVEIQRELLSGNAVLLNSRRMQFRIGINLGDVIVEDQRLYGDSVNIAARVESLAEGGRHLPLKHGLRSG